MKKSIFIFASFISIFSFAQEKYKYAVVPSKFSFLKENNQYNLNATSKKMLESYNLITYKEDQLPENFNSCQAVFLDLSEEKSMFVTKITILLKDCKNKVIFTSQEGTSRNKEYKFSYNEALRNASKSIQNFDFIIKSENSKTIATPEISKPITQDITQNNSTETYKLQNSANGYLLVNSKNQTIAELQKTSNPSIFIAKSNEYQGVANISFKTCTIEYYQNNQLIQKTFPIE